MSDPPRRRSSLPFAHIALAKVNYSTTMILCQEIEQPSSDIPPDLRIFSQIVTQGGACYTGFQTAIITEGAAMTAIDLREAEEVRQVIRAWLTAASNWDQTAMEQLFASDPQAIHFGTASDETYIGSETYLHAMAKQHTSTIPDMAFDFLPGSPAIQARDNVAWVVGEARISGTTANHRYFQFNTRVTFVLEKVTGVWRIVHSHYSIGVAAPA
jgi:ketosteroid isomerase-like protein